MAPEALNETEFLIISAPADKLPSAGPLLPQGRQKGIRRVKRTGKQSHRRPLVH
jgi:hypothetical protein